MQVSHNFDDITDINSPPSWGFMQQDPRTFYMCDTNGDPLPIGQEIQLYTYPDLGKIGPAKIVSAAVPASSQQNPAVQTHWTDSTPCNRSMPSAAA